MRLIAKRLALLAIVVHIFLNPAFADWLLDGVLIPDDAKFVPPSAAVPESRQRYEVPSGNGHRLISSPLLWTDYVDRYLNSIEAEAKQ
jgi:hypothetical protein